MPDRLADVTRGEVPGAGSFSLLGFTVVLALIALAGLKPWQGDSVEPHLRLPGLEADVGNSVALPPGPVALVADATAAPQGAKLARADRKSSEAEGPATALAVAPAQAVAVAGTPAEPGSPEPETGTGNEVPSDGATAVEAPPEGTSLPVSAPASTGGEVGPRRPVAASGPALESCEGDEYVIAIVLSPDGAEGEEASVEIVLQRFNEDGSIDELVLEGSLLDARSLALQLSSEGNCVYLEAGAPAGEEVPSDGTSQVVVPSEGTSSPAPDPVSEEAVEDPGTDALAAPTSP